MDEDFAFTCDEESDKEELARHAVWTFLQSRINRPPRLRVNRPCGFFLARALEASTYFEAVLLKGSQLGTADFYVRKLVGNFRQDSLYFKLYGLANAVQRLREDSRDGYAIVYRVDKIEGIEDIRRISKTLREELTHWKQNYFGNGSAAGLLIATDVTSYPLWDRIRSALLQRNYRADDPALLVAEAGAKAAAGVAEDLGLTPEEGSDFLAFYFLQLLKRHGYRTAINILQFVDRSEILRLHAIGKTYTSDE